jgi:hypothetical protein
MNLLFGGALGVLLDLLKPVGKLEQIHPGDVFEVDSLTLGDEIVERVTNQLQRLVSAS